MLISYVIISPLQLSKIQKRSNCQKITHILNTFLLQKHGAAHDSDWVGDGRSSQQVDTQPWNTKTWRSIKISKLEQVWRRTGAVMLHHLCRLRPHNTATQKATRSLWDWGGGPTYLITTTQFLSATKYDAEKVQRFFRNQPHTHEVEPRMQTQQEA